MTATLSHITDYFEHSFGGITWALIRASPLIKTTIRLDGPSTGYFETSSNRHRSWRMSHRKAVVQERDMQKTWPSHINLFLFSVASKKWTSGPSTSFNFWATDKILLSHSLSTTKKRYSDTESSHSCYVSEGCSSTNINMHIVLLIDRWILRWYHRCFKLLNCNRTVLYRTITNPVSDRLVTCNCPSNEGHLFNPFLPLGERGSVSN